MEVLTIEKLLKSKLFLAIMITVIICIMIGTVLLVMLWSYLTEYENSTPQYYIDKFLDAIEKNDMDLAMQLAGVNKSDFLTQKDYQQYMFDMLGTDFSNLKIIEDSKNENKLIYSIVNTSSKKISLELQKNTAKKEFGIDLYTIKQTLPLRSMKIIAPANVKIKVNETPLTEQHKLNTSETVKSFDTLDDKTLLPQLAIYQVDGFLYEPNLFIDGLNPQDFVVSKQQETMTISLPPKAETKKQVETFAMQVSRAYANYISKDAKFSDFSQYLIKETSFYKSIRNFDNSWYIDHDSVTFANEKVTDTLAYSDTHFTTSVSFDYIVTKGRTKKTYPTKYKLSIMQQGNTFKIINLETL